LPIADCRFKRHCESQDPSIGNQKSAIGNGSPVADGLLFKPSVFALHTKSEETEVSSWIDLIAFARSGAILSTSIFSSSHALSRSGIVFVTIIFSMSD
jgi:hypothetical protein